MLTSLLKEETVPEVPQSGQYVLSIVERPVQRGRVDRRPGCRLLEVRETSAGLRECEALYYF